MDGVGLTYDAFGRMVEQNRSGSYTEIVYAPTGAKLALMNGQSLVKGFVPLPGGATAVYTSTGLDHYRHSDWLGSARVTSSTARVYLSGVAYAPFGETYAQSGTPDPSFTGQNSDTSSGDYDFLFREYGTQGRWPSPDPAGLAAVKRANPQTWNRYAYALNNPLSMIDRLGLDCIYMTGGIVDIARGDCLSANDNGLFVNGTVTYASLGLDGTLVFAFSADDPRASGAVIVQDSVPGFGGWNWSRSSGSSSGADSPLLDFWEGNCPTGWHLVPVPFGPSRCIPGHQLGDFVREPRNRQREILDNRARALANAVNRTGIQSLANPCTVMTFYGGSAVLGFAGGALAGGEAAAAGSAAYQASAPYWPLVYSYFYRQTMTGVPVMRFLNRLPDRVQSACNSLQ